MALFPGASERLSEVFAASPVRDFDDNDKYIIFSDCHRGDNSWKDDYAHNRNLHLHALSYYLEKGFNYIELGDGVQIGHVGREPYRCLAPDLLQYAVVQLRLAIPSLKA